MDVGQEPHRKAQAFEPSGSPAAKSDVLSTPSPRHSPGFLRDTVVAKKVVISVAFAHANSCTLVSALSESFRISLDHCAHMAGRLGVARSSPIAHPGLLATSSPLLLRWCTSFTTTSSR